MIKKISLILLILLQLPNIAQALSFSNKTELVTVKVIPEYSSISTNTKEITFITQADIATGWHLYWDNPGDVGTPTKLTFYDAIHYIPIEEYHSAPHKSIYENIITSYVYTKRVYFKNTFTLNNLKDLNRLPFSLNLSYSACKETCEKEQIDMDFALSINTEEKNPSYFEALANAENTFPLPLQASANITQNLLELKFEENILDNCDKAEFVSRHPKDSLENFPISSPTSSNTLTVNFEQNQLPPDFDGILLCHEKVYELKPHLHSSTTSSDEKPEAEEIPSSNSDNLLYYILTAFVAGLILNLMPCVLPVLSLKALHLVQNPKNISALSGISYLLGVVCSFMVLASLLFYLRHIGTELGWGFQLQSPTFNIILLILFIIIFLSLIDKLPISPAFTDKLSQISNNQSFLTGFFAVLIACPCTGPFMGAALGYAITKPGIIYFSIFLALSLGYALPYTLIEIFPNFFLKYIPKPGKWMLTFKKVLALPILLTCFWLIWVISNQLRPTELPNATVTWETYSDEEVQSAQKKNQPVFINFTAKWCLVCLLNDKSTLSSASFKKLAQDKKIRLFKADWTNHDAEISTALQKYGRNSIPLYVYYPPKQKDAVILPQILTPEIVKEYFN